MVPPCTCQLLSGLIITFMFSSLFKVALRVPIYHRLLVLMVKLNLLGNMAHNICFMCFFLLLSVLTV